MKDITYNPSLVAVLALVIMTACLASPGMAENTDDMDSKPGPAYTTLDGTITKIEGDTYTVRNESANAEDLRNWVNDVTIVVGKDTKKLRGDKKVGDKVRAELTRGWFANSMQ